MLDRGAHAELFDLVRRSGVEEPDFRVRADGAVEYPDRRDDAPILVVVGVEDQRSKRLIWMCCWRRDPGDDCVQQLWHPFAGLCRDAEHLISGNAEHALDLSGIALGISCGKVDLVQRGDDLEVVLERERAVRERLCLDAL